MNETFKVGDGASVFGYSDSSAYTVIEVSKSGKRITIQRDKSTLMNGMNSEAIDKLICHPGGYCGHVEGKQRWEFERNPDGYKTFASLRKNGKWIIQGESAKGGTRVSTGRHEYYDYNF